MDKYFHNELERFHRRQGFRKVFNKFKLIIRNYELFFTVSKSSFSLNFMGCSQSVSGSFDPKEISLSQAIKQPNILSSSEQLGKIQAVARQLVEGFSVVISMNERLEKTAYSTEQVMSLADAIITAAVELENVETPAEKQTIQQFFMKQCQQLHQDDQLYYHQFVKMFKQNFSDKEKTKLKPESLSRIYNLIANFKKREKVDEEYENNFKVPCWKTNGYKELSETELDEVVKLDGVAEKILSLGDNLNFKFNSILQETDNMANLLSKCFKEHHSHILGLKYDLEPSEIQTVAKISRQACDSHDNGVFLLLVYFVKACINLEQNQKKSVKFIQEKMETALEMITKEYPPGQGLTNEQQHLRNALINLAYPKEEDKQKAKFEHPAEPLGKEDKQTQLEQIIMKYAKIAKHNKPHFEELVKSTCVNLCLQTKIGLKYYPDNPNEKALTRIKEKMLFKKDVAAEKSSWNSIAETIKGEAQSYRQQVNKLLAEKTEIQFKISDMVRGKCTFISISDIIETIDQIKRFVAEDEQKRFRITEIESRFTNKVPISDVTLKIAINEEIVAQLQLTVQTNAPAYNFAHKIYELQRTKVFSKVKIAHNYFEEFKQDFKEVCKRSLELARHEVDMMPEEDRMCLERMDKGAYADAQEKKEVKKKADSISQEHKRAAIIHKHSKIIQDYFELSQVQTLQLKDALKRALHKQYEEQAQSVPKFIIAGDQRLQHLILPLFNKQMGHWYQTLGKAINEVLTSEAHSLALKATLLNYFLAGLSISKEAQKMRQFFPTYRQIAGRQREFSSSQFQVGKQFMQFYLKHIFSIDNPFVNPFSSYNAKVHLKARQTRQLSLGQKYESHPVLLVVNSVVQGVIVQEGSPERIDFLKDVIDGYFILRRRNRQLCEQFEQFYRWLMQIFEKNQQLDTGIVRSQVRLLGAQKLLQKGQSTEAQPLLQQTVKVFKQKEENGKFLEAQLLLTEVLAQDPNKKIKDVQDFYQTNKEKAKNLGIQMRGETVANAEWRIAKSLWENAKPDEKENVINHFCCAVSESSRSEGEEFILKWKAVDELMVQESQQIKEKLMKGLEIKPNAAIEYINLSYNFIEDQGCEHLAKAEWKNLATLHLGNSDCDQGVNRIGDKGCEHLAKAEWRNLATLILGNSDCDQGNNQIGAQGCEHLAKAEWKNLATLDLGNSDCDQGNNQIGDEGCEHLAKAEWKNLATLNLGNSDCDQGNNQIGDEGCQHLAKAEWSKNLATLYLGNSDCDQGVNRIGDKGCQHLAKAEWKNLAALALGNSDCDQGNNQIGAQGCEHLAKAEWKNLATLDLGNSDCDQDNNQIAQVARKSLRSMFRQEKLAISW